MSYASGSTAAESAPGGGRHGRLLAVLAVALAVRLANLWLTAEMPIAEYQFRWDQGDMAANYLWSERILRGDILSRESGRPWRATGSGASDCVSWRSAWSTSR